MTREKLDDVLAIVMRERAREFVSYPDALPPEAIKRILRAGKGAEALITAIKLEVAEIEFGLEPAQTAWRVAS